MNVGCHVRSTPLLRLFALSGFEGPPSVEHTLSLLFISRHLAHAEPTLPTLPLLPDCSQNKKLKRGFLGRPATTQRP